MSYLPGHIKILLIYTFHMLYLKCANWYCLLITTKLDAKKFLMYFLRLFFFFSLSTYYVELSVDDGDHTAVTPRSR